MRVQMIPSLEDSAGGKSGIARVIEAYYRYLPNYGIELVGKGADYDIRAVHAGLTGSDCDVAILHGIYFTADYASADWEFKVNHNVVNAIRAAKIVTVPSSWVAEIFQRDMHFTPTVVPHGIEADAWAHKEPNLGYVLWNKNRAGQDVCNPISVGELAKLANDVQFITTFAPPNVPYNVKEIGTQSFPEMKKIVQQAGVYLSTTKETFGIGVLEAMASGVPVLGWAFGGNTDTIKHGITGYLAQPGNYDDLFNGLVYCLMNREVLGRNAIEVAHQWTWDVGIERLYNVFQAAAHVEPTSVSVIIPTYNYADRVGRAIESAINQTYKPKEIIVVDDGSTDSTKEEVQKYQQNTEVVVKYIRQDNAGVANARNNGVWASTGKYVCCLDADDAIAPQFLERCVSALEHDQTLSIAYTRLQWIKPDGSTGVSDWPGRYDYDAQLRHQNQIPTCCVIKRKVWERLGGQRQRYAPLGAGAEDAEFWTRSGAYGLYAALVTEEPLFIYSWGSGRVAGNPDYKEEDWLAWHPWAKDNYHPLASLAKPKYYSHKVRQYDEPAVSVIIPVGAGHEKLVADALDSLEAQTFRRWCVVVVWDSPVQPSKQLLDAYPFIRLFHTPKPKSGAGVARNIGAKHARAGFLLFLDADDYLAPTCLERLLKEWQYNQGIIYSDYYGTHIVNDPKDGSIEDKIVSYNPRTKEAILRHSAQDYSCERAQKQPDLNDVYYWCLVTCLIPKAWHDEIGGYDETMESWEDVDYHWRLARKGYCYIHMTDYLMTYRFFTGSRREKASAISNRQIGQKLLEYMHAKYEKEAKMPCATCGHSQSPPYVPPEQRQQQAWGGAHSFENPAIVSDNDYTEIEYFSLNRGEEPVYGGRTKKFYGYRVPGEHFLVLIVDMEADPAKFRRANSSMATTIPVSTIQAPPSPPAIMLQSQPSAFDAQMELSAAEYVKKDEPPKEKSKVEPIAEPQVKPPALSSSGTVVDLQVLPGVTPAIAEQMKKEGLTTLEAIISAGEDGLKKLDGVGAVRARMIVTYVQDLTKK